MKTGKRVWSALLALLMVFGMIVPVHAEDAASTEESALTGFAVNSITVSQEKVNAATTFSDLITVAEDTATWEENVSMTAVFVNPDDNLNGSLAVMQYVFEGLTLTDGENRGENSMWQAGYAYQWPLTVTYGGNSYSAPCLVKVVANEGDEFVTRVTGISVADVTMTAQNMSTLTYDDGTSVQVYNPGTMNPMVTLTYNTGITRTFPWQSIMVMSQGAMDMGHMQDLATTSSWTVSETPYAWEVQLVDMATMQTLATCTMNITVKEEPKISSVKVSDVVMFEGAAYYVDDGEGGQLLYFDIAAQRPDVVLTYDDGTSTTYTYNQLVSQGYSLQDADYGQNWSAGNTYEWPMVLVSGNTVVTQTSVNVAVYAEGKVPEGIGVVPVRVEVADVTISEDDATLTQSPDGTVTEHYDLYQANPLVTIHYSDGTSQSVNLLDMYSTGYQISVGFMPTSTWTVGTYAVTTYLTDVKAYTRVTPDCEYQVTITQGSGEGGSTSAPSITGISVDPISMKENEKYAVTLSDGSTGYIFNPRDKNPQITIYYSDGTNQVYNWNELPELTPYTVGYTSANGLLDTMGWTAGNTYEFPIALMTDVNDDSTTVATYTVLVDILPPELEVTGITVDPVTMIHGLEQEWFADAEGEFLGYNIREKNPTVTVTYNDGTTYQGTWQDFENQGKGNIGFTTVDTKSWAEPGTYTQKVWIDEVEAQVSVTLTENPVASVTFAPVTMVQGIDTINWGFPDGTSADVYDFRQLGDPNMTVTFNDGREPLETSWWGISQYGYDMPEYYDDMRDTADWGVGEHTFKVRVLGKIVDVTVIIEEDPIQSVTVTEVTLTEGQDRYVENFWNPETEQQEPMNVLNLNRANAVITITYKDGTVKSGTIQELNEAGVRAWIAQDITATANWTEGNTYDVTYEVEGHKVTGKVKLVPNPIKSVEIAPLQIKYTEGSNSSYPDPVTGEWVYYRYYDVHGRTNITIHYTDGTSKTVRYQELYQEGYKDCYLNVDQSADAVWQPGSTHTATFQGLGVELDFQITIVDDRVKAVTAVAQYPLYAEISGYADSVANTEPLFTVTKADGTTLTCTFGQLSERLPGSQIGPMGLETEPEEWALPVGKHNVVVTIDGVTCTFPITVLENPVADVKVITRHPFVEGVHGFTDWYEDENGEMVEYFRYHYDFLPYTVQVTLKDGTVETYSNPDDIYEKYRCNNTVPWFSSNPAAISGPGTYTVDIYIMGLETKQSITVIPSNVKSITAAYKGQLVENVDGVWETGMVNGVETEYFYYCAKEEDLEFTVTYTDGTVEKLGVYDKILGKPIEELFWGEDSQSAETPWTVGKHAVKISMLGFDITVDVEVVKNNLEKISAKATKELYEDWHWGSYDGGQTKFYDFWYAFPEVTLTYTDGTSKTYSYTQLQKEFGYDNVGFSQIAVGEPGTKKVTLRLQNLTCEFDTEVKPNPVASITAKPSKTLTEGYLGLTTDLLYTDGQRYTFYNYVPQDTKPVYTVTMTDGTVYTLYGDDQVFEKFHFYPYMEGMTPDKPWGVGKHTVKVELMGKVFDYTFEIVKAPNPLVKITAKAVGTLYENADVYSTELHNYEALVEITQHFQDGTTKTGMANKTLDEAGRNSVEFSDDQQMAPWGVGIHKATASYKGFEAEFEIEVIANPYTEIAISNEGGFTVTLTRADGSKTVCKASDFQVRDLSSTGCNGNLVTDQGTFFVAFRYVGGQESEITYMEYQGLRSNSLSGCSWLDQKLTTETVGDVPEFQMGYVETTGGTEGEEEQTKKEEMTAQAMKDLVASESDENRGGVSRVWMTVTEVTTEDLTEEEAEEVEKALDSLEDHETGIVLDLSIYKQYSTGETSKVSETSKPVVITMAVPKSVIDSGEALAEFKVIRVHNGVAEILDTVYDKETQTISFETDSFSAYSLTYSSHKLTEVKAKSATCTQAGNTAYYTCSHCDKLFADSEAKTETNKAAVTVAAAGHKLTEVKAKAGTCTEDGLIGHWTCSVCEKNFFDEEGKNEVGTSLVSKASGHSFVKKAAQAATCTKDGYVEHWECCVCFALFADAEGKNPTTAEKVKVPAGHKLTKVEAKAATVEAEGCKEHYKCDTCGELFADAEGKTAVKAADLVIAKLPKPADGSNAQTGDTVPVGMLMLLAIVSGMLLVGECLFGRKKRG